MFAKKNSMRISILKKVISYTCLEWRNIEQRQVLWLVLRIENSYDQAVWILTLNTATILSWWPNLIWDSWKEV
jgi:hypothetical protein